MSIRKYIILTLSALAGHAAAVAQTPVVEYLYNNANTAYFHVSPDPNLEKLTMDIYTDVRTFSKIGTVDLLSEEMAGLAVSGLENVYAIPVTTSDDAVIVYQLKYKYAGGTEVTGKLYDGDDPFVYMTDLPQGSGNIAVGWGSAKYNIAYNGTDPLQTLKSKYAKGYGVHGAGWVRTNSAAVDLSQFSRFCADLGGQIITNPTRGNLGFILYNGQNTKRLETGNVTWQTVTSWDYTIEDSTPGSVLKIDFTNGGDGNTNDIVCIGAPRFYYKEAGPTKEPQTVEFDTP